MMMRNSLNLRNNLWSKWNLFCLTFNRKLHKSSTMREFGNTEFTIKPTNYKVLVLRVRWNAMECFI